MKTCVGCRHSFEPIAHGPTRYCLLPCYRRNRAKRRGTFICDLCHVQFSTFDRHTSKYRPRFCGQLCYARWRRAHPDDFVAPRPDLIASQSPTTHDIAWAAGIYEGEGSVMAKNICPTLSVSQKDPWLPIKLKQLFGGGVSPKRGGTLNGKYYGDISNWYISGARARGFMMTIYSFLSPKRKEKIAEILRRETLYAAI